MSMTTTIYVGPYLEVRGGDPALVCDEHYDDLVTDGRGEAAEDGEPIILIPNMDMGIRRQMRFDRNQGTYVVPVAPLDIDGEQATFYHMASGLIAAYEAAGATVASNWGIVPCVH